MLAATAFYDDPLTLFLMGLTVMIKVAEGTMLEFDKGAVAVVHKKDSAVAK